MKYLVIFISLIVCDELELYKTSLNWTDSSYNANNYKKNNHGIKRITTEYTDGNVHEIIYYNNGYLKSKGLYKKGLRRYSWKFCDRNYNCVCEYYDINGKTKGSDGICD